MNRNALKSPADVPVCRHTCDGIYIRHKDYFRKYLYSDLLWVKASGCYCDLYFRDKSRLTVAFPLAVVISRLPWRFVCPSSPQLCRQPLRYRNVFRQHRADSPPGLSHRSFLSSRLSCPLEYSERRPSFFPDGSDDLATN